MNEVILFPDVEGLVINYLNSVLADTEVSTLVPDPRPTRFVRVSRVGGNKVRLNAESAMVTFQCWEEDTIKAAELAQLARAYVNALEGLFLNGVWIYRVIEVGGPAYNPDPTTGDARYQFTVSIDVKGDSL
jgi:hypothetical protein